MLHYLQVYESDLVTKYLNQENEDSVSSVSSDSIIHKEVNEYTRAKLFDWVYHCTDICLMLEENIFFMVVHLIDLYNNNV